MKVYYFHTFNTSTILLVVTGEKSTLLSRKVHELVIYYMCDYWSHA